MGYHVVAPDTRGYGGSTVTKNASDYRLEQHSADMLALLKHLGAEKAVWIGHDWYVDLPLSLRKKWGAVWGAVSS